VKKVVRLDFTTFRNFFDCPYWWRNFVKTTHQSINSTDNRDLALDRGIGKYNGRIVDIEDNSSMINYLEFETEDDLNAFKIFWTLK
jgi:hypothetical protein